MSPFWGKVELQPNLTSLFVFVFFLIHCLIHSEMCLLSNNIKDYHYVSQGKTEIDGVDDGQEMKAADVS